MNDSYCSLKGSMELKKVWMNGQRMKEYVYDMITTIIILYCSCLLYGVRGDRVWVGYDAIYGNDAQFHTHALMDMIDATLI
jgi:hypothetical protein